MTTLFLLLRVYIFLSYLSGPALTVSTSLNQSAQPSPEQNPPAITSRTDIQVDSGFILAFGATSDENGTIYVAVCTPESLLKIYQSEDGGNYWREPLRILLPAQVKSVELLKGYGDSAYLFVFYLTPDAGGDLWLLRIQPDLSNWQNLPLAVGPDTVDQFAVALDPSPNYYLYCLYINQHRSGRNGRFTRSLDYGITWEMEQDFYNTFDPHLSLGANSVLHCIWRFAINSREIHYTQNRYYGAPARWSGLQVLYATGEKCFNPKVAQADTTPPWRAPIWAVWTIARRDTEMLDLVSSFSTDGGNSFSTPVTLGEIFIDEWWPSIFADQGSSYLVYNAGDRFSAGQTSVYYRYARAYAPQAWSSPVSLNDQRANALFNGARPRALPNGALFCYYGQTWANGLYFARALPLTQSKPPTGFTIGNNKALFDVTGRRIYADHSNIKRGVYFIKEKNRLQKLLICQ